MNKIATPELLPPRSHGQISVVAKSLGAGRSGLADLHQSGSAKILLTAGNANVDGVIINTSGGVTGGDRFAVNATAQDGAHLSLTTQAAERIYKSTDSQPGRVHNRIVVHKDARLDWLPQETILFDRANLNRRLDVEVHPDATALIVEPVIFGRLAMGETVSQASFVDRITVMSAGAVQFQDATRLTGDIAATLDRTAVGNGARAMALVLLASPSAAGQLAPVRALLPTTAGASLLNPSLLVCRIMAADSFALRQTLIPLLDHLTLSQTPRSWRL